MDQNLLIGIVALMIAVSGCAAVFVLPGGSSSQRVSKRAAAIANAGRVRNGKAEAPDHSKERRKQVQDTLKELEAKQKAQKKRITMRRRLERAGLHMAPKTFYIVSGVAGAIALLLGAVTGQPPFVTIGLAFVGGFGLPRWFINMKTNSRQKKFLMEFSNSIDVIVRGVKSGLPVNESLKIIAREAPSPVREEFEDLVESQRIGVSMEQALQRMFDRMPLAEVNFFGIVLLLQQSAGGNLSEALGNLADVLRGRKKMKGKIEAMSSEAKASAMIIGSLPFVVGGLFFVISPEYIMLLFKTPLGKLMLMAAGAWMSIGIFVMRSMINFKV